MSLSSPILRYSTTNVIHCASLPIVFPGIPETGTKSRVETQVRITVDLAHASSSQGPFLKYDRVGSWKCLKLPPNTSTKRRTRKEGKIGMINHPPHHSFPFVLSFGFVPRCCAPRNVAIDSGGHVLLPTTHAGRSLFKLPIPGGTVEFSSPETLALIAFRRNVRPERLRQGLNQTQRNILLSDPMPPSVCSNSTAQRSSTCPLDPWSFPCASHAIVGTIVKKLDLMSISRWSTTMGELSARVLRLQS